MKIKLNKQVSIFIVLFISLILLSSCNKQLYKMDTNKSYYIDDIDIYNSSIDVLESMSVYNFKEDTYELTKNAYCFGEINDAQKAAEITLQISDWIFDGQCQKEQPLIIKYNEEYDIWIVHGSESKEHKGVICAVYERNTGQTIMLLHTP